MKNKALQDGLDSILEQVGDLRAQVEVAANLSKEEADRKTEEATKLKERLSEASKSAGSGGSGFARVMRRIIHWREKGEWTKKIAEIRQALDEVDGLINGKKPVPPEPKLLPTELKEKILAELQIDPSRETVEIKQDMRKVRLASKDFNKAASGVSWIGIIREGGDWMISENSEAGTVRQDSEAKKEQFEKLFKQATRFVGGNDLQLSVLQGLHILRMGGVIASYFDLVNRRTNIDSLEVLADLKEQTAKIANQSVRSAVSDELVQKLLMHQHSSAEPRTGGKLLSVGNAILESRVNFLRTPTKELSVDEYERNVDKYIKGTVREAEKALDLERKEGGPIGSLEANGYYMLARFLNDHLVARKKLGPVASSNPKRYKELDSLQLHLALWKIGEQISLKPWQKGEYLSHFLSRQIEEPSRTLAQERRDALQKSFAEYKTRRSGIGMPGISPTRI
jgi:hypothetical protein